MSKEKRDADIKAIVSDIRELSKQLRKLNEKVTKLSGGVVLVNAEEAARVVASLRAELGDLHEHVQTNIQKHSVLTELPFLVRHRAPESLPRLYEAIIWAFEQPMDWWQERTDRTLGNWIERLPVEYREGSVARLAA